MSNNPLALGSLNVKFKTFKTIYTVESLMREGPNAPKYKSANQISVILNLERM